MASSFKNLLNYQAFRFALAWIGAATLLWVVKGWQLELAPGPKAPIADFPTKSIVSLLLMAITVPLIIINGMFYLRVFRFPLPESFTVHLALGFLTTTTLFGIAGGLAGFLVIAPGVIHLFTLPGLIGFVYTRQWERVPRIRQPNIFEVVSLVFFFLVLAAALAPAVESDGIRYHLTIAQEWIKSGSFTPFPYNANSNLPSLQSLLAASTVGLDNLGRIYQLYHVIHFGALIILGDAIVGLLLELNSSEEKMRLRGLTGFAILAIPAAAALSSWPFADVASCAYFIAGLWATIYTFKHSKPVVYLIAAGFLAAGIATKISTLPVTGVTGLFLLILLFVNRVPQKTIWIASIITLGSFVLLPWLIKNYIYHGNPLYPLAYTVLGGPEWSEANQEFYTSKFGEKGLGNDTMAFLVFPYNVTIKWKAFEAFNPGPMILAFLPVALLASLYTLLSREIGNPLKILSGFSLVLIIAGSLAWFMTYQSTRFYLPLEIFMTIVSMFYLSCAIIGRVEISRVVPYFLMILFLISSSWAPAFFWRGSFSYYAANGQLREELFIANKYNAYFAAEWLNEETINNEPVLYIGEFRAYYADTYRPLSSDFFDTPRILVEIRNSESNEAMIDDWKERGIRFILYNASELAAYEQGYFRPRFSNEEWERFTDLREQFEDWVVWEDGQGVFILSP